MIAKSSEIENVRFVRCGDIFSVANAVVGI